MQALTREFLDNCPQRDGFRMRGAEMTRIEVFVDAAFAFAVTMLVISFDAIPRTYPEMVTAIKTIPAFAIAVAQLVWIWQTHTMWSRRYGLDDAATTWLSALLLVVMLVYIYPMRIMLEGALSWLSGGYLPTSFELASIEELRFMFVFMGTAFAALCMTFVLMYRYALKCTARLVLNRLEQEKTRHVVRIWLGCMIIGLAVVLMALVLPTAYVPYSGFLLFLIGAWIYFIESRYTAARKETEQSQ